ncbi:MAG: divalent-cation tolerance protein CutA [Candidatus Eremiobacteraeota bacterium]|nr:divalent-cation tolerance protein CutA [Candidatus Eremiobacteraeota bacterium]
MFIIAFVMVPSEEVGVKIARKILNERLAACVNIKRDMRSLYWWDDKIQDAEEAMLIIKTKLGLYNEMEKIIRNEHPYKVPEIVAFPIARGYRPYMEWITRETKVSEDDIGLRGLSF